MPTPGPNLAFFVCPSPKGKKPKHPICRICHGTVEPGNMAMTIDYVIASGVEVTAYHHWRCVEQRAAEAGMNSEEKYFAIRNSLLEGGELFPSKD